MFDPRRHAVRPDLADSRLAELLPEDHPVVDGALEQVIAPVVPIFAHPSGTAERASEALLGERVMVFEDREGFSWCQLETDGYVGYIPTAALSPEMVEPTHRVSALRTFVYSDPDFKSGVSAALFMGSDVAVSAVDPDGFSQIGEREWLFSAHLSAVSAGPETDPVAIAAQFLHTPYLWGGRSSLGLDCSALVQRAFAGCGRTLPRDSDLQESEPVDWLEDMAGAEWAQARRGDLLFWPGHVALVSAPQTLIHASAHAMAVVQEPLAEAVARIEATGVGTPSLVRRPAFVAGD
ncbi:NlpC/P60 family protein [Alphaproteobacteria bacterium]|nr:NlpC/P60 family protein [Alphaproteobacteria bacterium]